MKKLFAISFLLIYLNSTTELHQLLKIPLLIEHFVEHKNENKDTNLWQFLCSHYIGHSKDSDYEKDLKLPFKSQDNCLTTISNFYLPQSGKITVQKPVQFSEKKLFSFKDNFSLPSCSSNIWQPPRVSNFL